MQAAECAKKVKNDFQLAENYQEAANMFLLGSSPKYDEALDAAVQSLLDLNRLSRAADMLMKSASAVYDKGFLDKALACYERAEKYYFADSQSTRCDKCKRLRAAIYSEKHEYEKAMGIYEELAKSILNGPLKFEAQNLHMKALLCRIALINDENRLMAVRDAEEQLDMYIQMNSYLEDTREEGIIRMLLEAVKNQDEDKFTEVLHLVQKLKMLDGWMTEVLLVIKENLPNSIL